jgi:ABC-type nitrate/sulfonate/bicarbonate transport system substrate-binding protein
VHEKAGMTDSDSISRRRLLSVGCSTAAAIALPRVVRAASAEPVDVVMTQGVSGLTVHEVARTQGFFDDFKIQPKVLQVSDGTKCVAALISGSAKICMWSGFNQLTPAIERGAKLKILAGALNLPSLTMYSAKPEIAKVADLQGKVIGIGSLGSVLHQMTVLLLKKKGVNVDKVQFRNVGSNAEILKSVIARTVDAGLSDVDVIDLQQKFGMHVLPDGMLWKEIPEYTNQGTYTSHEAIKEDRDQLVRVLAAYAKAYRFVSGPDSKAAFIQARHKITGNADTTQALTQWNWIQQYQPYALNLVLSDAQINFVQKLNVDFKVQRSQLPIAAIADMSLAREAVKLLRE